MSDNEMPKRIMECKPDGRRSVGRHRFRWKDAVEDDLRKLKVKNWCVIAKDRKLWKKIQRKPRLIMSCRTTDDDDDDDI
jgi:hypothetical protein